MTKVKKTVHSKNFVYICVAIVSCMSTIFGFNLGAILSSKVRLINVFMLEVYNVDSMINTFLLGALVGTFLGGRLVYDTGRLQSILGAFTFGVIGQSISLMSPTFSTLFISEFAVGAAFGVYLISSVSYITEISPSAYRGSCSSLIAVFFTLGLLLATVLRGVIPNYGFSVLSGIVLLSLPLLVYSYLRLPESPRWHALTGSSDKALTELIRLRVSTSEAARELAAINECILGEERGMALFFRSPVFRAVTWFFIFISISCQLAGMAILPYMSLQLIKSFQAAMTLGVLVPSAQSDINFVFLGFILLSAFFGAIFTFFAVDKIGRKKLFLFSVFSNEIIIAVIYVLLYGHFRELGQFFVVLLMCLFVFSSTVCLSLLLTVLASELLAVKGREFGLTVIYLFNFAAVMMGMYFFNRAVQSLGLLMLLSFFLIAGAFLFSLIYSGLPETKGKLLESMENTIFNGRNLLAIKSDSRD